MRSHPVMKTSALLLILLNLFITTAFVSSLTLFDWKIYLDNTSTKQTLSAHCQSTGEDVGKFTINPTGSVSFLSHVLVKQKTVASCSMTLGNLHGDFNVFDWDRDKGRCPDKTCLWRINEDGLSMLVNNEYVLQFRWP
ncbi:hypothetical protein Salat_2119000 [Sesamum alatum]|uniref:S-protein homolog n=1 Tax=Sesamum alatum TaxID=300844 RepID=A0AAE2CGY4_9LAMI|nr:hypothetical protein Salat_2119000 [Sesamum alatum]